MSNSLSTATPAPAYSNEPWGLWATLAWTAAALVALLAAQYTVFFGALFYFDIGDGAPMAEIVKLASHGVVLSLSAILTVPAQIGVIAFAIRRAHGRFADYLALVRPSRTYVLIGIACLVVLLPFADLVTWMTGRSIVPPFVIEAYKSARDSGQLWLLAIALVVAAPLAEEIVFRGFMYRGLAASRLGVAGAILVPSAIWAAIHVQYEAFFLVQIFLLARCSDCCAGNRDRPG